MIPPPQVILFLLIVDPVKREQKSSNRIYSASKDKVH